MKGLRFDRANQAQMKTAAVVNARRADSLKAIHSGSGLT